MNPETGPRPHLIVVDDEEGIRQIVARIARDAGFDTQTIGNSLHLLPALEGIVPDVIILDLNMEGKDGIEILRELAHHKVTSPIVLYSGSDIRVLEMAKSIGETQGLTILAALQKPMRKASLVEILNKVLVERQPFDAEALRQCLRDDLLQLHFQPKLSLSTFAITGCEALLRFNDAAGRPVPAETAIAIAERADMIDELSVWMFRRAISQVRQWRETSLDLAIAINLSALSSTNAELPSLFSAICQENNVSNGQVTIELTESAAMDEALVSHETLLRLRVKGFHLSVDDFGTGYSSLLRLRSLPFSEIKTDKSFVMNMHRSKDDEAIVGAVITLAKRLELHCVIEGAETQQAIDYAASLGCDEAQGYFISKAIAGHEIPSFIKTWQWRRNAFPRRTVDDDPSLSERIADQ